MAAQVPFTASVAHRNGVAVLTARGEIDMVTAPDLQAAIDGVLADDLTALVIDLLAVEFLASAGLQVLVETHSRVSESARFAVVAEGPATSRPIQLTHLDEIFALYPTLDEALKAVRIVQRAD